MRSSDIFRLNVKELMASQGLKVKDLADMVGLSASYLSLILSGDRGNLSDLHKDAVALALGTTVSRLYAPPDDALFGTAERPADYGRPARFEEKSPGDALSETARFDGRTVAATPLQGRPRDIRALEDFLNVLNIRDPYLLKAIYRELNYLSDREVAKLGQVLLNALVSWQEQAGERQLKDEGRGEGPPPKLLPPEPDHRIVLGLVAFLVPILGQVSPELLEAATSWSRSHVYQVLGGLFSLGLLQPVETSAGMLLDLPDRSRTQMLRNLISGDLRKNAGLAVARSLARAFEGGTPGPTEGQIGELYLEGGDLNAARQWLGRAAESAFSDRAWHLTRGYLRLVLSLDTVLKSAPDKRTMANQMMVTTCLNLGDLDLALAYQKANIVYWENADNRADLVRGLSMLSLILARKGQWAAALEELERALKLSQAGSSQEARLMLSIAGIHLQTGWLQHAKEEFDRVLDFSASSQDSGMMAQALLGLGRVYLARGDAARARTFFNRGLALTEKRELVIEAQTRLELGKVHFLNGQHGQSRFELEKARGVLEKIGDSALEHMVNVWLARCLARSDVRAECEKARYLAETAYAYFETVLDKEGTVFSLLARAEVESALGSHSETFALFGDAVRVARESGNPALESHAAGAFALWLQREGDELAPVMFERSRWIQAKLH